MEKSKVILLQSALGYQHCQRITQQSEKKADAAEEERAQKIDHGSAEKHEGQKHQAHVLPQDFLFEFILTEVSGDYEFKIRKGIRSAFIQPIYKKYHEIFLRSVLLNFIDCQPHRFDQIYRRPNEFHIFRRFVTYQISNF